MVANRVPIVDRLDFLYDTEARVIPIWVVLEQREEPHDRGLVAPAMTDEP